MRRHYHVAKVNTTVQPNSFRLSYLLPPRSLHMLEWLRTYHGVEAVVWYHNEEAFAAFVTVYPSAVHGEETHWQKWKGYLFGVGHYSARILALVRPSFPVKKGQIKGRYWRCQECLITLSSLVEREYCHVGYQKFRGEFTTNLEHFCDPFDSNEEITKHPFPYSVYNR